MIVIIMISLAFEICFDMDSPRVNGSELFLSFDSTVPVDSAVCSVETLPDQDCKFLSIIIFNSLFYTVADKDDYS